MKTANTYIKLIVSITGIALVLLVVALFVWKRDSFVPPAPDDLSPVASLMLKGTVAEYGSNPDEDIDKLLLKTEDEEYWVHFPPHTAKKVLAVATPGANIEALIGNDKKPLPDGIAQKELLSVTNTKNGKTFSLRDVQPPPPAEGTEVEVSGNIAGYKNDEKGDRLRGIVIGKNLIRLPPHSLESIQPLLEENKSITVKGWKRNPASGFVNKDSLVVIRPSVFIVDGVQYVIQ